MVFRGQAKENRMAARTHVGSKIEFRVDGKVLAAPVIREPISSGSIQIDLGDQANTAADLAAQISRSDARVEVVVSH